MQQLVKNVNKYIVSQDQTPNEEKGDKHTQDNVDVTFGAVNDPEMIEEVVEDR